MSSVAGAHILRRMKVSLIALLLGAADPQAVPPSEPSSELPLTESSSASDSPIPEAPPPTARLRLPAMTPVYVKLGQEMASNRNKSGDRFPLVVAEDVRVGESVVIPAGTPGEGEVIHAAKSGGGGKPGELLLAARFVRVIDIDVRLRSMVLGKAGKERTGETLAASFVIGPFAMFVRGGAVVVPPGTIASAKTAIEIELPATEPSAPPPEQPVDENNVDESKGGENDETKTT